MTGKYKSMAGRSACGKINSACGGGCCGGQDLKAGTASSDITTRRKGARIIDRAYAKALVLDNGSDKLALVTMDAVAIGGICDIRDDFLDELRGLIRTEIGILPEKVIVTASHTHPSGEMLLPHGQLIKATLGAVRRAAKKMVPVLAGSGSGKEEEFAINRTLRLKNGRHWTARHANPCPPDDAVAGLGPLDTEVGILKFDRLDGTPFAVIYNFACHPLWNDPASSITANYPGLASSIIEEHLGHGAMAFFLQGALGDVMDIHYKDFKRPRDNSPFGKYLALEVLRILPHIATGGADLRVVRETFSLPRRNDIPGLIKKLREEQSALLESLMTTAFNFKEFLPHFLNHRLYPDYPLDYSFRYIRERARGSSRLDEMDKFNRRNVEKYLSNIEAMEKLAHIQDDITTLRKHAEFNEKSGSRTIPAEIVAARIGDTAIVSAPMELLTQIGLNIKKASPFRRTLVASLSNGYMHYGCPADYYGKGGYEVTECFLAPEWQKIFEKHASKALKSLKA